MPTIDGTVTPEDVAAYLTIPVNDRVEQCTDAAVRWAINRRSFTDPDTLFWEGDVNLGTILYASLLYQARATPSGFSGYEDVSAFPQSSEALYRARDLVGSDPVTA